MAVMIPNVPKLTTAAWKMSSSRINSAPIFAANSAFSTGFDALSIHSVRPVPVAMCRPATKTGLADQRVDGLADVPEQLEAGEHRAVGTDVVDVDDLCDGRPVSDVDAAPRLRAKPFAVDHRLRPSVQGPGLRRRAAAAPADLR